MQKINATIRKRQLDSGHLGQLQIRTIEQWYN